MNRIQKIIENSFPNYFYPRAIEKEKKAFEKKKESGFKIDEECEHEHHMTLDYLYESWEWTKSNKLLLQARKLDVHIPDIKVGDQVSTYWEGHEYAGYYLNSKGRNLIRKEIDHLQHNRRDKIVSFFSLLFGLIGGLTGLLAVIFSQ
jgi:hypothetical protein